MERSILMFGAVVEQLYLNIFINDDGCLVCEFKKGYHFTFIVIKAAVAKLSLPQK